MLKNVLLIIMLLCVCRCAYGQEDTASGGMNGLNTNGKHLRISLITCGPGDEEVYEVFGHTAVRVIDSTLQTDIVFNYGTFEYGPDFEMKFMRGKLLYCLAVDRYDDFIREYIKAKRSVEEQVLLLGDKQKDQVYSFLKWNAQPEHKFYKYDFFFDNCATRIRDIFPSPEVFDRDFHFGEARPGGKRLTFRDIINAYFYKDQWTRLGVNILLGSRIDRVMTNADIMFLPDYLRDGVAGATVNGNKIAATTVLISPGSKNEPAGTNWVLIFTISVAILTISGLTVNKLRLLGRIMTMLLLIVTGLLGCLILVMWFATDHQGCGNNYNLLWCLPLNIVIALFNPKGKGKYALIAMVLIFVSLLLHLFRVQGLLFLEMSPILLALLFIYGTIYGQSKKKQIAN